MPRGKATVADLIIYLQGLVEVDPPVAGYSVLMEGTEASSVWNGKILTHTDYLWIELEADL